MDQKQLAEFLVRKFHTRDPFQIAHELDIQIVFVPLHGIRGFYQYVKRCALLYIDSNLSEHEARFVCAHELGHALMHRGYNRIFLDTHAYFKTDRFEIEADQFAVDLLYSDDDLSPLLEYPVQITADYMGVSIALAEYRLKEIVNLRDDRKI